MAIAGENGPASLDQAAQAVSAVMSSGILPATLEMMDQTTINVVEDYLGIGLPRTAEAMLILEQDGRITGIAVPSRVPAAVTHLQEILPDCRHEILHLSRSIAADGQHVGSAVRAQVGAALRVVINPLPHLFE